MSARAVLILSLAVNLALAAIAAQRLAARTVAPAPAGPRIIAPSASTLQSTLPATVPPARPPADAAPGTPAPTAETPAKTVFDWSRIESPDFRQLIANLRAVGCPEQTIRDLVTAAVMRLYAPRLAALRGTDRPFRFWDSTENVWTPERIERERKIRAVVKERNDLLKELLDVDPVAERRKLLGLLEPQAELLTYLSKEKAGQVQEILRQFNERRQEVSLRSRGFRDAEDEAELRRLEKEQRAAIAAVLTPEELFEHELREFGRGAELASFGPTEAEFRAVFKLQHDLELAQADFDHKSATPEQRRALVAATKQQAADLKVALGETRYAEYERSRQWDYQRLEQITDRYELGKETAVKVWEMRQAAEAHASKLNADATLTDETREAARLALRLETEKTLQSTLGDRAWKSFLRNGGDWLDNVAQLPSPPETPKP